MELGVGNGSTNVARSQEGDALLGGTGVRQGQAPAYDGQVPYAPLGEHLLLVPATRERAYSLPLKDEDEKRAIQCGRL